MTNENRLLSIAFRAAALFNPSRGRIKRNYELNRTLEQEISGYINGQRIGPVAGFRYGTHRYAGVGCEIIATYNSLCALGVRASISDIGRRYEACGGEMLLGAWGTNPFSIEKVMAGYGVCLRRFESIAGLSAYAHPNGIGKTALILSFWNKKGNIFRGIHTVAVEYAEGKYIAYNRFDTIPYALAYDSIGAMIGNGKLIVGYIATEQKQK